MNNVIEAALFSLISENMIKGSRCCDFRYEYKPNLSHPFWMKFENLIDFRRGPDTGNRFVSVLRSPLDTLEIIS